MPDEYARVRMVDVESVPGITQEVIVRALRALKAVPLPDDARVRRMEIDLKRKSVTLEV
jgi:hypothetical protein